MLSHVLNGLVAPTLFKLEFENMWPERITYLERRRGLHIFNGEDYHYYHYVGRTVELRTPDRKSSWDGPRSTDTTNATHAQNVLSLSKY